MSTLFRRTAKIIASTYKNDLYPRHLYESSEKKLLTDCKNTAIIHDVNSNGMWLSLVERLLWEQDAAGSSPVIPTIVVADDKKPTVQKLSAFIICLEESCYYSVRGYVYSFCRRRFRETRHSHYIPCQNNHETGTG